MTTRMTIKCPIIIIVTIFVATNKNYVIAAEKSHNDIHAAFLPSTTLTFPQQQQKRCKSVSQKYPTLESQQHRRHLRYRPPRTTSILPSLPTDVSATAALVANTAASATETALEYVSSTVARETIHRAPILSLTLSFVLGGIFFSTIAAAFAGVIALGKENTRRLREVVAIVIRRNWSVMKISMMFTMVRRTNHLNCLTS